MTPGDGAESRAVGHQSVERREGAGRCEGIGNGSWCAVVGAVWRTSSYSASNGGQCVEVARNLPAIVAVRDSRDPGGAPLVLPPAAWAAFVDRVKREACLARRPSLLRAGLRRPMAGHRDRGAGLACGRRAGLAYRHHVPE
jgi:hypothetical protein